MAVAWCRRRFPDSVVDYQVADLFDLPEEWGGAFDLVVEVGTVQSLPPNLQTETLQAVMDLTSPGGTLLLVALTRPPGIVPVGPPWPLCEADLEPVTDGGFIVENSEIKGSPPATYLSIKYRRPPD
jgi:hypothetical protein